MQANVQAKTYVDGRGWKYKVLRGESSYKVGFQHDLRPWYKTWQRCFPWCPTFGEAQCGLDRHAKAKGWKEWQNE